MFLRALNAPDTLAMRRAVAIWLRFESGTTVRGNNPWNLHSGPICPVEKGYCPGQGSLPGQIGNRYAGTGDKNVAVFGTLQDGVKAAANNLISHGSNYGYDHVVSAARKGDPLGFLVAIQNSGWSTGHYGFTKLVSAFKSTFSYNNKVTLVNYSGATSGTGGDVGSGTTVSVDLTNPANWDKLNLKDWVKAVLGPTATDNYVLTQRDVDQLVADATKRFESLGTFPGKAEALQGVATGFQSLNGKSVGSLSGTLTLPPLPKAGPFDFLSGIGSAAAFALDPENWAYIFLLVGGGIITFYGFALLMSVTGPASFAVEAPKIPTTTVTTQEKKGDRIITTTRPK